MTHLTAEELKSWFEHGKAADRERVIAHLAACDTCRTALSMLAAGKPVTATPAITAAEAVEMGHAARKAALGRWSWLESPILRLGAAAIIVFLVIWATTPTVNQTRTPPTLAVGETPGSAAAFSWETPFPSQRYRITVRDANGVLVFSGETGAPPYRTDAAMRAKLSAGESYTWKVEALNATGSVVIGESRPVTFRYRPQ